MNAFLKALGLITLAVVMTIFDYWMIQKIYSIVLVPHGAPFLSKWDLWGVGLFIFAIAPTPVNKEKQSTTDNITNAVHKTLMIAFCWLLAHLVFG